MTFFRPNQNVFWIFSFLFLLFSGPGLLHAQAVSLSSSKSSYTTNDSILVTARVQTGGQQINTASGQISFPGNSGSVSDVRFGNSIISLWVVKPTASNSLGTIDFTGGMPGGFSGNSGTLFTFVIKPKKEGLITISLKDVHILLNDGSGGEISGLKLIPLTLNITKASAVTPSTPAPIQETPIAVADTVPPESFVPLVGHDPSIANDSYFVSFFAVDKDSGVASYQVREVPKIISVFTDKFSTPWIEATSPHILSMQSWGTRVEVKAIDGAGNSTVASVDKPFGTIPMLIFALLLILLSVLITRISSRRSVHTRRK